MEGISVKDSWSFRLVGFERGLGLRYYYVHHKDD